MAVNEQYKSFVEICRKDGVYVDKRSNYEVKVSKGEIFTKGRNKKWERHYGSVNMPNKKRFLSYSRRQAQLG